MNKEIDYIIDKLIPRGGETPQGIYVSLEEYLSRLSNLNRKITGVEYRIKRWTETCEEFLKKYDKMIQNATKYEFSERKTSSVKHALTDIKLENEFETLLYAISASLSSLTRFIACFLKDSINFHSHSKLANILVRKKDMPELLFLVKGAWDLWAKEMTERRDAATHHIALNINSSISISKTNTGKLERVVNRIGIPKKPIKYISLWDDMLPTINGSSYTLFINENGEELHELLDANDITVVRRNSRLPAKPELIDGYLYIESLYNHFSEYNKSILKLLTPKSQNYSQQEYCQ